jgi:type VII secretion-associated protein (TIGR03931 family)
MTTAVCTVGPVTVGRLPDGHLAEPLLVDAALDGGDGRVVLVGDEPVPLRQVWTDSLRPLLDGASRAVLIHPSWWTAPRIGVLHSAAGDLVADVELRSRSATLARNRPTAVVVEIASHAVLVIVDGLVTTAHERSSLPATVAQRVADTVRAAGRGRPVVVDAPAHLPGAQALSTRISAALSSAGVHCAVDGDDQIIRAATGFAVTSPPDPPADPPSRLRWPSVLATAGVAAAVLGAGMSMSPADRAEHPATAPVTALVEGRVTLQIPADWIVRRVTGGPGSARVQVISPVDSDAVVHVTQSGAVAPDLAATASALRRAVDAHPPGTFVDFNPTDRRAGRPAVTYREIRPGRDILWTVLIDGDVRICIGCQNAAGRSIAVAAACDDAIRTAQRLP